MTARIHDGVPPAVDARLDIEGNTKRHHLRFAFNRLSSGFPDLFQLFRAEVAQSSGSGQQYAIALLA